MRILLITDSLGCPREEINVSDTWTDQIIKKWSKRGHTIYTYCRHGLYAAILDMTYITELEPDIIIIQIGIVDSCRRALSLAELNFVQHIPKIRTIVKKYCNKHHYAITSKRNIHYCKLSKFSEAINKIVLRTNAKVCFIAIAPPGKGLIEKVYNIKKDVIDYNQSIMENHELMFINPYEGIDPESILLSDGHHLNIEGNRIIYHKVDEMLKTLTGEVDAKCTIS